MSCSCRLLPSLEPEILKKAEETSHSTTGRFSLNVCDPFCACPSIMTANVQGSNILDVLKKKMRATKEECEKFKEEAEDLQRKLGVEINRREDVKICAFFKFDVEVIFSPLQHDYFLTDILKKCDNHFLS